MRSTTNRGGGRYARVSTNGQTLASQESQLAGAGCAKVYAEKVSGARSDRAEHLRGVFDELTGLSARGAAKELNARGIGCGMPI